LFFGRLLLLLFLFSLIDDLLGLITEFKQVNLAFKVHCLLRTGHQRGKVVVVFEPVNPGLSVDALGEIVEINFLRGVHFGGLVVVKVAGFAEQNDGVGLQVLQPVINMALSQTAPSSHHFQLALLKHWRIPLEGLNAVVDAQGFQQQFEPGSRLGPVGWLRVNAISSLQEVRDDVGANEGEGDSRVFLFVCQVNEFFGEIADHGENGRVAFDLRSLVADQAQVLRRVFLPHLLQEGLDSVGGSVLSGHPVVRLPRHENRFLRLSVVFHDGIFHPAQLFRKLFDRFVLFPRYLDLIRERLVDLASVHHLAAHGRQLHLSFLRHNGKLLFLDRFQV